MGRCQEALNISDENRVSEKFQEPKFRAPTGVSCRTSPFAELRGGNVPAEKQVLLSLQELLGCSTVGNLKTIPDAPFLFPLQCQLRQNAEKTTGQEA